MDKNPIFFDVDDRYQYSFRVINPGDELSLIHELWWQEPPTKHIFQKGTDLSIELIEQKLMIDPELSPCIEGDEIYHSKLKGFKLKAGYI